MLVERFFTRPDYVLPSNIFKDGEEAFSVFQYVDMEARDVVLTGKNGEIIFEQRNVVVPVFWGETATTILATKYFRGTLGTSGRETTLKQVIDRITGAIEKTFITHKYGTRAEAKILRDELSYMMIHQIMAFNSPVWFNVGVKDVPQQVSACFILDAEDEMDSILNWYVEEGKIFKGGSGAGINLSKIRSSKELLKGGGTASGPVSFMRGADASAGTIKSGGKTRRAAKMVVLDADHPDIREFIWCKAHEEKKIRALSDAGFDVGFDGKDLNSIQYQNANNSVRITDDFMLAVLGDDEWALTARSTGETIETVSAQTLWREIAHAAWECADPGVQFDTTINAWNTTPNAGRIDASNPCSEHMRLANSSCNLASINLMKFFDANLSASFDIVAFTNAAHITFLAQNVLIDLADFPTEKIKEVTLRFRDLGLGYANLGALLMSMGLSYDSDSGREVAASITSLLTATAYTTSSLIASAHGSNDGFEPSSLKIAQRHREEAFNLKNVVNARTSELRSESLSAWNDAVSMFKQYGVRNSQMTVLAPTGTIGLLMGCDTTGVEPAFDLTTYKSLVGGGVIASHIGAVDNAFTTLGIAHIDEAPDVFKTAAGVNALSPEAHVLMMGAVQPFISGAISKTVNLPNDATVDDIERIHMLAWDKGVKSIAVYRDGCKAAQPLSGSQKTPEASKPTVEVVSTRTERERLPRQRKGHTRAFKIAALEGYMTTGEYDDGRLGELFLRVSKQGSTLAGIVDAWSIAVSLGLQYGVPLESFIEKYASMRFEPNGFTSDEDIRITSSLADFIFRRLALDYLDAEKREQFGVYTKDERIEMIENEITDAIVEEVGQVRTEKSEVAHSNAPMCYACGSFMRPAGACHVCETCGATSGCS